MAVSRTWDQARLSQFANFLLSDTLLVVSETESQTLARQVFITANDRGVQLRPIDIFKGQLLTLAEDGAAAEMVARRWNGILHVIGNGIEDFMCAYDFVKRCQPGWRGPPDQACRQHRTEIWASPP